jgi:hypothetical protein
MRRITRAMLAVAACGVCSVGTVAAASNGDKVLLCHGTASEKNPYVLISVSENALAGHFDGTAPGHGKNNHDDFLPPAGSSDCSSGGGGGGGGEF